MTKRLGWIRDKASPEEAHRVLEAAIPDDCKLNLHVNLIQHGRTICRAAGNGGPRCESCFLTRHCAFAASHFDRAALKPRRSTPAPVGVPAGSDFFVTTD